jgi:hypothetical protein
MNWGLTQGVFAWMALSLLFLGAYLVRGSRRWLVATRVLAAGFVVVPAAAAAPAVFNDSGPVQLPLLPMHHVVVRWIAWGSASVPGRSA